MRLIIQRYKYPKTRAVTDETAMTSQALTMSCIHCVVISPVSLLWYDATKLSTTVLTAPVYSEEAVGRQNPVPNGAAANVS